MDSLGEAYVTGTTDCPKFPVTPNVFNTLCGGDGQCGASWNPQGFSVYNGFITKLNVAGSALIYSGILGYYEDVTCRAIAVDGAENAYVTGEVGPNIQETTPLVPPETPPPLFPTLNGFETTQGNSGTSFGGVGTDAFIVKIDASGSEILYSSYIGGGDEDVGYGVAVDGSANAYVTGITYSTNFPTAGGALKPAYAGAGDAFLTKVNTNATGTASLLYSSYFGGSGLDQGNGVAVDASGNAYIAGVTTSKAGTLGFTIPTSAYQANCTLDSLLACEGDAFVAKFALSGTPALVYFTYLGGSLADSANGIALDSSGDAYVTGSTVSTDFPISGAVFQTTYGGGNADAFVTELNPAGSALVFSTYLGGSNTDTGNGIAVDSGNPASAYIAGQTCSVDFPLANSLQAATSGSCDAFISKVSILEGIALNPAGLVFPTQSLGTRSQPQTVTLTNGDNTQTISGISITGTNAGDFAETNNCPSSLIARAQCTITVTFTPTAAGIRKASVKIIDSAPGSPHFIALTGSTSSVGLSASNLDFGNQQVGVASSSQPVTVTNDGTTALTITAINASGAYSQTNDCTIAPLQPTTNCVINVTFTPTAPGPSLGALTIIDNAPGSPQVALLTGTGVAGPAVSLAPTNLSFPPQVVSTSGTPQSVILTNLGGSALNITNVAVSGDFAETNTCGSSVASGTGCTITITFIPTATGGRYGSVTITDNAANSPQTVLLSGTGIPAAGGSVTLSPTTLTFTNTQLGTTSAAQTVTLTNTGSAALNISSVGASGDFAQLNNCGATVAAANSCTINVTFTPTATGNRYGSVTISDSATNSPQIILLAGNGSSAPAVAFLPASLTFANQNVNTTSLPQNVVLTNTGGAVLNITNIIASGDFAQGNSCGPSLGSGASCTIAVTFTPTASGPRAGAVTVTDNAPGSPHTLPLNGTGVLAPVVALSPTNLTFSGQSVGSTSVAQLVTLTNVGKAVLEFTNVTTTGDFGQTNNCPASLAAGASCVINVTFTPTVPGNRYGSVNIADNAPDSPQIIVLAGTGLPAPVVSLSVASLTISSQAVGTTSAPQSITMSNTGTAPLIIASIAVTGDFAQLNTCGASLAVGASCTISVTFTPTAAGSRTGSLIITDNAPGSPQVVSLGGSGADFAISVTPASTTVIAGNSSAYTFTVTPHFGFNGKVMLGCIGAPRNATCSVSPTSVQPNGTDAVTATVTVTTGQRSLAPPGSGPNLNWPRLVTRVRPPWFLWLLLLLSLLASQAMARRRRVLLRLALVTGLVLLWAACGGGGGSQVDVAPGTPQGSYTLTLSGTSGPVTHSVTASLTVQ